jgi:hypothetical protein
MGDEGMNKNIMSHEPINLLNEKEIFDYDRNKPQILDANSVPENVGIAVGFASRCWSEENGKGEFDVQSALRIMSELCAYIRVLLEKKNE